MPLVHRDSSWVGVVGRGRVGVESKATAIPRRFVVVRGGVGDEVRSRAPRKLGWDGTSFDGTCPVGGGSRRGRGRGGVGVAAWEGSRKGWAIPAATRPPF